MEYKIANSGWVCELKAISEGDSPKFKSYDYGLLGIVERVTVSCSRDNWRNVVFRSLQCRMFDTGNDEVKVIQSEDGAGGGLSFSHLNNKGEKIFYHFTIFCEMMDFYIF